MLALLAFFPIGLPFLLSPPLAPTDIVVMKLIRSLLVVLTFITSALGSQATKSDQNEIAVYAHAIVRNPATLVSRRHAKVSCSQLEIWHEV
jgi:hypothetical protein